jgi:secretion/DNA translocation related CpaE-like protein
VTNARRRVVLVTRDDELERTVLAAGAAVGRLVEPIAVESVSSAWADAGSVLIGCDLAGEVADRALPRRTGVYVVAPEAARADACGWSMPLGAAVLVLPDGARWLSSIISGAHSSDAGRVLVCGVVGGSGGVGASTLAAGVASAAARRRRSVALVDVDVAGGGLDLLLRAEEVPGWRWSRLRTARGQIGDLRGKVPSIDGIDLISMGRVGESDVGRDAVTAVIASLGRTHEIVVLDIGRDLGAAAAEAVRLCDRLIVMCGQDVRSVAAARMVREATGAAGVPGAVVRLGPAPAVSPSAVADALGLHLWGVVPHDRALVGAGDRGLPSARTAKRWAAACDGVLDHLTAEPAVPAPKRRWSLR